MTSVIFDYLALLNIPISKKYFKKCVLSHPDYPSLLSIADTLERLGIPHQIGKIERENLGEVSFPYLLQIDKADGQFLLVKHQDSLAEYQFYLDEWDGVIMKAEHTDSIADVEHNKQYAEEKFQRNISVMLVAALFGLIVLMSTAAGTSLLYLLLVATSIGGTIVGYLLLAKDLGVTYAPVETFCSAGKRTNCDRILNAEDANLFGHFTFTDAAASYFFFQLIMAGLFIPLMAIPSPFLLVLSAAAIFSVPVIGYSLYYQHTKAQTWCRLCLIVDGLLAVQVLLFVSMYASGFFNLTDIAAWPAAASVLFFAVVACSILLFKNRLETANTSRQAEIGAKRVKHNPVVFTELLHQQAPVDVTPFNQEMIIGNPNAIVQVFMVANLHCNPCSIAFSAIQKLTKIYPQKVCFSIRFTPGLNKSISDLSASSYLIRYWQQHIQKEPDQRARTQTLIRDWYAQMNPDTFARKYPANGALQIESNGTVLLEEQHYRWVKENKITRTPTFFINGYIMPNSYRIDDLIPMLPGLAALINERKKQINLQNQELAKKQEG